jgi:hypothetical protein
MPAAIGCTIRHNKAETQTASSRDGALELRTASLTFELLQIDLIDKDLRLITGSPAHSSEKYSDAYRV